MRKLGSMPLSLVLENISDLVARFDRELRCLYMNSSFARVLGISREGTIGKTLRNILPEYGEGSNAHLENALRQVFQGRDRRVETKWRLHEQVRHFDVIIVPEKDDSGVVSSVLWVARDITESQPRDEALAEGEREMLSLAESSPDFIIRYDRKGRIRYLNHKLQEFLGLPAHELIGKRPCEVWPDGRFSGIERAAERAVGEGASSHVKYGFQGAEGENRYHEIYVVPDKGADGQIVGTIAFGHDITALIEAEKYLEKSHAQLRGLAAQLETVREEERRRIASDMHDELGQHLTALRLDISVLRMRIDTQPELLEQVRAMSATVDRTIQVVRDIASSLRPAPLKLGALPALEWLVEEFHKRSEVQCSLQSDVEEHWLGDRHATVIFRTVQESLNNIARHANATQVVIKLTRRREHLLLEVSDNGDGFHPTQVNGNTFGLLGMRERVITSGGEISISSSPGQGTKISVNIPIGIEEDDTLRDIYTAG